MNDIIKIAVIALVASVIGGFVAGLVGNQSDFGNATASFWDVTGSGNYRVDGTVVIDANGNVDAPITSSTGTFSGTLTTNGIVTANAGVIRSYVNSTTTSNTTYTLLEADILNYDVMIMQPLVGALTLTMPATSTMTSMIPAVGDMQETCFYNSTTTAAATITFATGTGHDFARVATSTTAGTSGQLAIPALGSACIKFIREADTDVTTVMYPHIGI